MKFEECKIGDIVTPKSDEIETCNYFGNITSYIASTKKFMITGLNYGTQTVDITPIISLSTETASVTRAGFEFVSPSCLILSCLTTIETMLNAKFDLKYLDQNSFKDKICMPDNNLDFEVHREANELTAYYHGVKLATVKCHPNDVYDEEFGLHLLLRRACLKLKDEHTVVETVEEFLQNRKLHSGG